MIQRTLTSRLAPPATAVARPSPSYCPDCEAVTYTGRLECDRCGGEELEALPQVGSIYSYTVVRQSAGRDPENRPYVLALVRLCGGPLVMGQVVDVDADDLDIGQFVDLLVTPAEGRPTTASARFLFSPVGAS